MDRSWFGRWGAELSGDDFAAALAASGLVGPAPAPEQPLRLRYTGRWLERLRAASPSALVLAWQSARPQLPSPARAAVEFDPAPDSAESREGPLWLLEQLLRPGVGLQSAFLSISANPQEAAWNWPVRTGVLPGPRGSRLRDEIVYARAASDFLNRLTELPDTTANSTLDLLLLPEPLSAAVQAVESAPAPVHAHAVAVLDGIGTTRWSEADAAQQRLRRLTRAQAVLVADIPDHSAWFADVIAQLSHNSPFDVALRFAGAVYGRGDAVLWASPAILEASQILPFTRRMLARAGDRDDIIVYLDPTTAGRIGMPPGSHWLHDILPRCEAYIGDLGWLHESDGATAVAELNRALLFQPRSSRPQFRGNFGFMFEAPEPEGRPARYLQAAVHADLRGRPVRLRQAFSAHHPHTISVHIGPPEAGTSRTRERFPDELLPQTNEGGHLLSVVLFEPRLMPEPQLEIMFLPLTGAADPCTFTLPPPLAVPDIEARITVLHENRVLQTALLRGRVESRGDDELAALSSIPTPSAASPATEESLATIHFAPEGEVNCALSDLASRPRFDAALVLNHAGEAPGALGIRGYKAAYVRLDEADIRAKTQEIDTLLNRSDWDLPEFQALESNGTVELLRKLAFAGKDLYRAIVPDFAEHIAGARKIQVVSAKPSSRFPVEFLYDPNAPAPGAPLCPNARQALATGMCPETCAPGGEDAAPFVCPLGFWCMNRIIERHAFSEERVDRLKGAPFALETENPDHTATVKLLHHPLLGYSNRVIDAEPDSITNLAQAIQTATNNAPAVVDSWNSWKTNVQTLASTFLLLLIHTDRDKLQGFPTMELGVDALATMYLNRQYVHSSLAPSPPIVLLLGCSTGLAKIQFQSFVAEFQRLRPAIVVSTSATIYGPEAARLAALFVGRLRNASGDTFGQVMLDVRRRALAEGRPMILCLTAWGDADWRLEN